MAINRVIINAVSAVMLVLRKCSQYCSVRAHARPQGFGGLETSGPAKQAQHDSPCVSTISHVNSSCTSRTFSLLLAVVACMGTLVVSTSEQDDCVVSASSPVKFCCRVVATTVISVATLLTMNIATCCAPSCVSVHFRDSVLTSATAFEEIAQALFPRSFVSLCPVGVTVTLPCGHKQRALPQRAGSRDAQANTVASAGLFASCLWAPWGHDACHGHRDP